jgi:hypothetical protein
MPAHCSTCGAHVAKAIGSSAAFCTDQCSDAYARALEKHPVRIGDKVHVSADSYAAAVCSTCPALVHQNCTDVEQVRTADGTYLLPQAVADPITAWVERIGVDIRQLPGESRARFLLRRALGITDAQERRRLAGLAAPSAAEKKRKLAAEAEESAAKFARPTVIPTQLPPRSVFTEAERATSALDYAREAQNPPAELILRLVKELPPAQLAAIARTNKHFARVIDLNGLLLRYARPKYVLQRTARAILEEDLVVFRVCVHHIEETMTVLLPQLISALHKGCTQIGLETQHDFIVWSWLSEVLAALPNRNAEIDAEMLRITTHDEFRNEEEHPEDVFSIALGLPPLYRDDDAGGLFTAQDFSDANAPFPRRELTDEELHLLAFEAAIRKRCLRALLWLYRARAGPHLSFTQTCVYNLNNLRSGTTFVMPSGVPRQETLGRELGESQFNYFVPLEFGQVLQMWRTLVAESRASMPQLGIYVTAEDTNPLICDFTSTLADALVPMFCSVVPLEVLCKWILVGVPDPLQDIWTAEVFRWVRTRPDAISILTRLAALQFASNIALSNELSESLVLFNTRVREALSDAVRAPAVAAPPIDPANVVADADLASFKAMLLAPTSSLSVLADAIEIIAVDMCTHGPRPSQCIEALHFGLVQLGHDPITMTEKVGNALVDLLGQQPAAEQQRVFHIGLAPLEHIINSLGTGTSVDLSRLAADMTAYHICDTQALSRAKNARFAVHISPILIVMGAEHRGIYAPRSRRPRPASFASDPAGEVAAAFQIFNLDHGCSAFTSWMAGAVSRMNVANDDAWLVLHDLGNAVQRSLLVARNSLHLTELEFHYELASFGLRLVALEWLVFDYALRPSINLHMIGALIRGVANAVRTTVLSVPELVVTRWTELDRLFQDVYNVTEPLWQACHQTTFLETRTTDPAAYKAAADNAWAQLKQAKQRLNPPFLTAAAHRLVLFQAALPRPAYRDAEPAFTMLTIPAEDVDEQRREQQQRAALSAASTPAQLGPFSLGAAGAFESPSMQAILQAAENRRRAAAAAAAAATSSLSTAAIPAPTPAPAYAPGSAPSLSAAAASAYAPDVSASTDTQMGSPEV